MVVMGKKLDFGLIFDHNIILNVILNVAWWSLCTGSVYKYTVYKYTAACKDEMCMSI